MKVKFKTVMLNASQMTPAVLSSARKVVARAQFAMAMPASTMFLRHLFFKTIWGFMSIVFVMWLGHLRQWAYIVNLPPLLSIPVIILTEWLILYVSASVGLALFIFNVSQNPIVQARTIFGAPHDPRSAFFVTMVATTPKFEEIAGTLLFIAGASNVAKNKHRLVPTELIDDDTAVIRYVGCEPKFFGSGMGWAMMAKCLEHAKAQGIKRVVLHTETIMSQALKMYTTLGFAVVKRESIIRPLGYDAIIMSIDI